MLAPGTARRRALDDALAEIDAGREEPSVEWRREYSLMLGLERLLADDEPHLADGTTLNAHQVDALSGTLIALLAGDPERQGATARNGERQGRGRGAPRRARRSSRATRRSPRTRSPSTGTPADEEEADDEEEQLPEQPEDPGASRRFWFEHATGAGKTVAAMGFVEASRTGGILILTHRRNLVDQFNGELNDRGYKKRASAALLKDGKEPRANGPVTVETYQWFVRNAGNISDAYTIVICDEAHTALGEKTSAAIRKWLGPVFVGMTATGALIARHVTDLFPTQTSRFDLAQAARRGVIAPLRCVRIPPGVGVRTIANVPLRKGEVDQDFDQEELAALLDQGPFNAAVADLYRVRFKDLPGVVYSAGVKHANNVAKAFQDAGHQGEGRLGRDAQARADSHPRGLRARRDRRARQRDAARRGLELAARDGLHAPRADRLEARLPAAGRPRHAPQPGQGGGHRRGLRPPGHDARRPGRDAALAARPRRLPRRRDRGRPRPARPWPAPARRAARAAGDRTSSSGGGSSSSASCGGSRSRTSTGASSTCGRSSPARASPRTTGAARRRCCTSTRPASSGARFLVTCLQRNRNSQLRIRALQEIAASRDAEAFDEAVEIVGGWSRDERREGVKVLLQALAEKPIGRRDQAANWIWHLAEYTREVHEEYAVQRWPETKRLLGLLVNSSGGAHARNARRLVHAARKHDRRLATALLAAALAHTPEAADVLNGARARMARKPSAIARELLRNFPKGRRRRGGRRRGRKQPAGSAERKAAEGQGGQEGRGDARGRGARNRRRTSGRRGDRSRLADRARCTSPASSSTMPASVSTRSAPVIGDARRLTPPSVPGDGCPEESVALPPCREDLGGRRG